MRQVTTTEQIENFFFNDTATTEIYTKEIDAITKWAESKGSNPTATAYCAIVAAFNLGSKRGSLYQKNRASQQNRRNTPPCGVERRED